MPAGVGYGKAEQMAGLDAALAEAAPDLAGDQPGAGTVQCQVCQSLIDAATGAPVAPAGGPPVGSGPAAAAPGGGALPGWPPG